MLCFWHAAGVIKQTILPGAAHAATPAGCPPHRGALAPPQCRAGAADAAAAGHAHLPRSPVSLEVVSQQVGGIHYDHREAPFLHRAPKSLHQTGHVRLCISHTYTVRQTHKQPKATPRAPWQKPALHLSLSASHAQHGSAGLCPGILVRVELWCAATTAADTEQLLHTQRGLTLQFCLVAVLRVAHSLGARLLARQLLHLLLLHLLQMQQAAALSPVAQ